MTETLKEAKPSEKALRAFYMAMSHLNRTHESCLHELYSIDVAPLIAERDDAIAHDYRKLMCMGVGDGSGSLFVYGDYESIKAAQSRVFAYEKSLVERDALKARVAELEKERRNMDCAIARDGGRIAELHASLAASRRQVEGLKEDLERIHSAADEGSYRGCPHCLQVMGMIDDALSALDAPQPEAADE